MILSRLVIIGSLGYFKKLIVTPVKRLNNPEWLHKICLPYLLKVCGVKKRLLAWYMKQVTLHCALIDVSNQFVTSSCRPVFWTHTHKDQNSGLKELSRALSLLKITSNNFSGTYVLFCSVILISNGHNG